MRTEQPELCDAMEQWTEEEGVMAMQAEASGGGGKTLSYLNMQCPGRRASLLNYLSNKMAARVM